MPYFQKISYCFYNINANMTPRLSYSIDRADRNLKLHSRLDKCQAQSFSSCQKRKQGPNSAASDKAKVCYARHNHLLSS